jgi:uncharacterized protein (DUF1778 family)
MSSLSLRLPDSLHRKLREIAEKDDVSINQFIATAVAEKAAAVLTVEYLAERGRRADPRLFDRSLGRVPDVEPVPGDGLPKKARRYRTRRGGSRRRR